MKKITYIRGTFGGAVYLLATGTESIQERLYSAWTNHINSVQEAEIPEELREEFNAIHRVIHSNDGPQGYGNVPDTLRSLDDDAASKLASAICNFSTSLDNYKADHAID